MSAFMGVAIRFLQIQSLFPQTNTFARNVFFHANIKHLEASADVNISTFLLTKWG